MISDDTYVLTTKGLVKAKFIGVGDELITALNNKSKVLGFDSSPSLCNKKVVTTYEDIECSDDLLFAYKYGPKQTIDYVYTMEHTIAWLNDIKGVRCKLPPITGWIGVNRKIKDSEYNKYYNIGFKGKEFPLNFEIESFYLRLELLAGILDSPVSKLFDDHAIITLKDVSAEYVDDLIYLMRSLGHSFTVKRNGDKVIIMLPFDGRYHKLPCKTMINYKPVKSENRWLFEITDIVDIPATITHPFILSRPNEPILVGRMLIPCYIKNVE